MKKVITVLLLHVLTQINLFGQSQRGPACIECSKYLYWTGEVNKDFFNENNWRIAVQLPSAPNPPDSASASAIKNIGTSVRPNCLPGANKQPYQICLVPQDPLRDRHPLPGAIDPDTPIKLNIYANNADIDINGNVVFESDLIGFTMDGTRLNFNNQLINGVLSIDSTSTVHFFDVDPLGSAAVINLKDAESWVYLHQEKPDSVIADSVNIWVNDEVATIDGNLRVNQYYFNGSLIRTMSADYKPLSIFSSPSLAGNSGTLNESIIYSGSAIPGGMNNRTASFVLKRGFMATFAINENGTGKSKVYIASESDLVVNALPQALQGDVSFIRVMPWNWVSKKGNGGFRNGLDAAWFYNWGSQENSRTNYEYVPMTWGFTASLPNSINQIIAKEKITHLLGFNEPDNCNGQSGQYGNLCNPEVAVAYYENLMGTGVRLGTPATTENGPMGWLKNFNLIAKEHDVRFDFVAVHWYDWGSNPANSPYEDPQKIFTRFKNYLANVYSIYGLPIWITEFNANPNRDNSVNAAFLQLALPYLEQLDYVERYAYFEPNSTGIPNTIVPSGFFDANGNMTNIGLIYKNQVSTPSIPETTYACPNNLEGMDLAYIEPITETLSFEAECALYKGSRWEVKTDSSASNLHMLQHNSGAAGGSVIADQFHYEFEIKTSEVFRLWIRMQSTAGTNGSLQIRMDDGQSESITGLTTTSYAWLRIARYYELNPGKHRLSISNVNDGTIVDKVALINTSNTISLTVDATSTACVLPPKDWGLVATDVTYWAEAESALPGSEWQIGSDNSAMGGKFMVPISGVSAIDMPPGTAGYLSFKMTIDADDEYTLWGKVQALTDASDAFWFSVDGEPFRKWDGLQSKVYQWQWQKFYFSEGPTARSFDYFLEKGDHSIVIAYSKPNTQLDRIAIASTQRNPALEDPNVLLKDPAMEFEAESATLLGAASVVACVSASNGQQVQLPNATTNGVRFSNIGIQNAGNYRLTIAYMSKDVRNFKLIVNGVDLGANSNYSLIPSGNWCYEGGAPANFYKVISLNAGTNKIDIKALGTNAPFIDKIALVREFASLEAENANLIGDASVEACARASNGLLVNLKTSPTNSIKFNNVFVDETATYYFDIHYVSKVARSAKLVINGVSEILSFDASGNWCYETGPSNAPKVKSLQRTLVNGINVIEIKNTGTDAPLIDKISILKVPASTSISTARIAATATNVESDPQASFQVYPNPIGINKALHVYVPGEQEEDFELTILDVNGRPVYQNNSVRSNQELVVPVEINSGVYFLNVFHNAQRYVHKLIVMN